jgi:glycosyltransferase involved in cell wall biosynthesis
LTTKPYKPTFRKRVKLALRSVHQLYRKIFVFNLIRVRRRSLLKKDGFNLTGYFSYVFGVAEVGRFFATKALQVGLPFNITNLHSISHQELSIENLNFYKPWFSTKSVYHKNILFINADEITRYYKTHRELFIGRYNVAYFSWEFEDYFNFPNAFKVVDEAIAFTDFIAKAVSKSAPPGFKVTKLNFPFIKNWEISYPPQVARNKYGIEADDFVFFFNFDFQSVYERKNPEAILQALDSAFTVEDQVTLVMKTIHAEHRSKSFSQFQTILKTMKLRQKVLLINTSLERNEMMSLVNAVDCYVSLHRSEGVGIGMMEAMSMGKPVIATAFGGNLDFMNNENSLLVNYTLIPLEEDALPYKKGWLWANPDIEQAAGYMKKLYDDRLFARMLGQKASDFISTKYSNEAFSIQMNNWLHDK